MKRSVALLLPLLTSLLWSACGSNNSNPGNSNNNASGAAGNGADATGPGVGGGLNVGPGAGDNSIPGSNDDFLNGPPPPTTLVIVDPHAMPALPADPSKHFMGTADTSRAPKLVYPNNGVMLPVNLKRLEVHWDPGSDKNKLFEISFTSAPTKGDVRIYVRCTNPTNNGCIYELDPAAYASVAITNHGAGPVSVRVRGSDDLGTGFGQSDQISVNFSEHSVKGGIYYWTTSNGTGIMRYDFGGVQTAPEVFMSPSTSGFDKCVGCHSLSRDGKKIVASLGGQGDGRIVYLNDLNQVGQFALKGDTNNRIQFASFNPTGERFVAVYGDTDKSNEQKKLWFHDGTTGKRIDSESVSLPFEPDHPDWSPDGAMIAITHVGVHHTSQQPFNGGIDLLTKGPSGQWGQPQMLLPIAPGLNRYNANFAPNSSFLIYNESTCPNGDSHNGACNGDSNPSAKLWAIQPKAGSPTIALSNADKAGIADRGATDLSNTFPRFAPFQQPEGSGQLMWATFSSRRAPGLHPLGISERKLPDQLLWMVAIDPAKVLAGQDGSYPAFFLPFQDITTSNHIGQWTSAIVGKPQKIAIH